MNSTLCLECVLNPNWRSIKSTIENDRIFKLYNDFEILSKNNNNNNNTDKLIFYKMLKNFKEKNTIFVASEKEKKN